MLQKNEKDAMSGVIRQLIKSIFPTFDTKYETRVNAFTLDYFSRGYDLEGDREREIEIFIRYNRIYPKGGRGFFVEFKRPTR